MKSMAKRTLSYAAVFMAGTLFSGGAVFAATTYVQAQKGTSQVVLNGNVVQQSPKLIYNGTTYVQLYSIEQALKQAGMGVNWNGTQFTMTTEQSNESPTATASNGTSNSGNSNTLTHVQFMQDTLQVAQTAQTILNDMENNVLSNNSSGLQNDITQLNDLQNQLTSWNVTSSGDASVKNDLSSAISDLISSANYAESYVASGDTNSSDLEESTDYLGQATTEISNASSDLQAEGISANNVTLVKLNDIVKAFAFH